MGLRGYFKFYEIDKTASRLTKWHLYLVAASPLPDDVNRTIVHIYLSIQNPPLPESLVYIFDKDVRQSLEEVYKIIANLPGNKGLKIIKDIEEINRQP